MRIIEDYEPLDFSKVLEIGKCAISCDTEEEAIHLLAAMKQRFPEHCTAWDFPYVSWGSYNHMAYAPYLDEEYEGMNYCSVSYYKRYGYTIIPFYELLAPLPEVIIDEDDFKSLLGCN